MALQMNELRICYNDLEQPGIALPQLPVSPGSHPATPQRLTTLPLVPKVQQMFCKHFQAANERSLPFQCNHPILQAGKVSSREDTFRGSCSKGRVSKL